MTCETCEECSLLGRYAHAEFITDELLGMLSGEAEQRLNAIKAERKLGTIAAIEWALEQQAARYLRALAVDAGKAA